MKVTDLQEIWQVEAGGQIYEARFEELAQWIEEGSLQRQDKVRRGGLRWIEAQKVPGLIELFNEKDSINFVSSTTVAQVSENFQSSAGNISSALPAVYLPEHASAAPFQNISGFSDSLKSFQNGRNNTHSRLKAEKFPSQNTSQASEICCVHQESAADYFCDTCANAFCKLCPSSYGGSVKICPFCGAMCQLIKKYEQERQERSGFQATFDEKFGIVDFTRALAHPFKYKTSLFFGAILFAVFSIGQTAAGIGGMFLMFSALFCVMASNMLTFGILANTVENFSQGKLETNFMPDFDEFSLWDDVVHPFFLSIGAYISAFGPFILAVIIGAYLVFSSMTAQNKAIQEEITKTPGTEFYDTGKTARQSDQVKQLTENLRRQNQQ
ncbi:MAG: B-box zinc finger protein, partial [Acidobacteriota bacterium]|nr:B-box zinc finger protein [Acidobacteriota bacterium]